MSHATQDQNSKQPNQKKRAEYLNSHFSKEHIQIGRRHMKRCSISPIIREMQIKTTMRYRLTPVRMAIIRRKNNWQIFKETNLYDPEKPLNSILVWTQVQVCICLHSPRNDFNTFSWLRTSE